MRIILFGLSFLALLVVAALVGPSFVDWNKYKPQIISQIENATGLNVKIDGDLGLGIFPSPHVTVNDLTIAAPKKQQFENILVMKTADINVALIPLLQKKVEIDSVRLVQPVVKVEMMADGTPSWTIEKTKQVADEVVEAPAEQIIEPAETAKNDALDSISLEELEIVDGEFVYYDHRTKASHSAQNVNVILKADSLKGPFDLEGDMVIDGKKIEMTAETGRLPTGDEALKVLAELSLPDADTSVSFNGVASTKAPYDAQGQAGMKISSPDKLAEILGVQSNFNQSLSLDGLLSANQNKISYDDLKLAIGDFVGSGKVSVDNLTNKNPLIVNADIKSSSSLNLDKIIPKSNAKAQSENSSNGSVAGVSKKSAALIPQSLTLPMDVSAAIKLDIAAVQYQGQNFKGAFIDLNKKGAQSKVNFKVLEMPGQGKASGNVDVAYGSSSKAASTGAITYSDPTVTYDVEGQVGQLATFLKTFAPDADTSAVSKLYKTAQFDLKGRVNANSISLRESTLKLDSTVIGLGGSYTPASGGARPKAAIDVSAGEIDFDKIMVAKGGAKSAGGNNGASSKAADPEKTLEPLKNFSLPLDLTFDVSLQKARIDAADLKGLRLTGSMIGKQLKLTNASVNDFAGAAINLKGSVANLSDLSGLDLALYTKTSDIKKLASALKVDVSKLPTELNALEANVSGKGTIKSLGFDANIKAMGGQLDVAGNAADLLGTPQFNNLVIGLTHPNLVKAIQVVSPSFKSQAGLAQPINFRSNATINGKKIDLTNMTVKLGQTDFNGNLKVDASSKVASVRGNIQAGKIALDALLGAKTSVGSSGSSSGSSSSSTGSSGKWSTKPIDLSFMNTTDVDVDLSAQSITYGAWNLTNPATKLKIGNGQTTINNLKAGVFGGTANFDATVKTSPVSLDVAADMSAIDLEQLVKALSGSGKLKTTGSVSFDMNVKSTGSSANALVNALNGKASLNGSDIIIKGFDLVKLARGLATEEKLAVSAMNLVDGALSGGQTKFDTLKGNYNISNGIVVIQSMALDSEEAIIQSTGSADLPKWFINVDNTVTLKNVEGLDPFVIKLKGSLDNPKTLGTNILEDYVQDKIKRKINKELGDKLPGILGEDATNALQQFGILPKKQAPAPVEPTPAPANDNVAPVETAPAETQPAEPAPEEPKKIEKPEDAVNELLNNENTEEAIGNIMKGLF